ncbi:MAG TPA: alcohol dehydrogenase catalytic domain-containing protein [Gaiellaceae bacterium]|nr:alcohol dehydrogenase catalytic domain-containing protein [Gaiellaceae bacterium]
MRAVALDHAAEPALAELPEPDGEGELVRVRACGLCGTDVQKIGRAAPGIVLGHEVVAEREDGSRAVLVHHRPCGKCARCRAGHESTCEQFPAPTIVPGGFAERARALEAIPLPDGIPDDVGTFAEPLACVLRALERVPPGRVLVVGCGFAGLLFVQTLLRRGDEVLASDPLPERLELARRYGARESDGPVDAAVLCAHAGLDSALAALEPGGTLLVFSWLTEPAPLDLEAVLRRELTVVGSCSATPAAMRDAIALLPELDPIPTVTLPLERFGEGLDLYRRHEAVKVVFAP